MQITLIRHLPTEWNKKNWLQGRRDISLTPLSVDFQQGIISNQELIKKMAPFDLVLASTLKRTHQTANLYGYEAEPECLLDELDFGPFEGKSKDDLIETYGDKWIENPKEIVLGESLLHLEKRILSFIEKYKGYENLLVFGHGSWIRAILSYKQFGDINFMNKMIVNNNQCHSIRFNKQWNE